MSRFERRTVLPVSAEEAFAWHARPGAFERLNPSFDPVEVVERTGGLEVGARTVIRLAVGPTRWRWVAEHTACEPGRMFRDEQREGPFKKWVHTHLFEPRADGTCELVDIIEYDAPPFGGGIAAATLERTFAYRHAMTVGDLSRHRAWADRPRLTFAVTGASGLVGSALIPFLSAGGHTVRAVKRSGDGFDVSALEGADVVVNLAGAGIADERWSDARKKVLEDSRVAYTGRLIEALRARGGRFPSVWLQGSAMGIYGARGDEVVTEASSIPVAVGSKPRGTEYLSKLCVDWEAAAAPARELGARVVPLRIGLVQSARGGALAKLLPSFKLGAGGPIAGGAAWQSWVAIDDLIAQMLHVAMTPTVDGAVNAVGPAPVTSREYAQVLGRVLGRPSFAPVPAFALRALFGELADGAIMASQRLLPERLTTSGFAFTHGTLESALRFTLGR